MRRMVIFLLMLLLASPVAAQNIRTSPSAQQLPGTATNDNANAGNLGEYLISNGPGQGGSSAAATATATISNATPGVVTVAAAGLLGNAVVYFTTSGTLPAPLAINTNYWTVGSSVTATTYQLATTAANAIAGTAINTTTNGSGTHTIHYGAFNTTNQVKDMAAVQLTPGDWDVYGAITANGDASTTLTSLTVGISQTSGTGDQTLNRTLFVAGNNAPLFSTASNVSAGTIATRYSVAVNTNVFLIGQCIYAVAACEYWGTLQARRRR